MTTQMITDSGPPPFPGFGKHGRVYPDPATKVGKAWAAVWTELNRAPAGEYLEGIALARGHAKVAGLQEVTVTNLLTRATAAGVLEVDHRPVQGKRGPRPRGFYRIAQP